MIGEHKDFDYVSPGCLIPNYHIYINVNGIGFAIEPARTPVGGLGRKIIFNRGGRKEATLYRTQCEGDNNIMMDWGFLNIERKLGKFILLSMHKRRDKGLFEWLQATMTITNETESEVYKGLIYTAEYKAFDKAQRNQPIPFYDIDVAYNAGRKIVNMCKVPPDTLGFIRLLSKDELHNKEERKQFRQIIVLDK